MQHSYHHASICANFSFNFLKKVIRDQRWPTSPLFIMNISPSFREFTAPLRHILPIHNITINRNNLFVNLCWTFTFCIEKSYDGTHLAFGRTLDWRCHFKHVSLKQNQFYHCQISTAHRYRFKVDGSVAIIGIKILPIGLHVMYLYFPDTPRTMSAKNKYFTINFIHLTPKHVRFYLPLPVIITVSIFTVSAFLFLTLTPNMPVLFTAIPQHIIISLIHCFGICSTS